MTQPIFHIAEVRLWEQALTAGSYARSTRGAALGDVGYIHCSFRHQVERVANFVYADWDEDLLLLHVDPEEVPSEIRVESVDGGADEFPHIYGPLPTTAVTAVHHLVRESGRWSLPPNRVASGADDDRER